ncbi:hypothetical protein Dimus_013748 [Dionaea muscipula]
MIGFHKHTWRSTGVSFMVMMRAGLGSSSTGEEVQAVGGCELHALENKPCSSFIGFTSDHSRRCCSCSRLGGSLFQLEANMNDEANSLVIPLLVFRRIVVDGFMYFIYKQQTFHVKQSVNQ